jgi:hypothetical protein
MDLGVLLTGTLWPRTYISRNLFGRNLFGRNLSVGTFGSLEPFSQELFLQERFGRNLLVGSVRPTLIYMWSAEHDFHILFASTLFYIYFNKPTIFSTNFEPLILKKLRVFEVTRDSIEVFTILR